MRLKTHAEINNFRCDLISAPENNFEKEILNRLGL
jgi:hypothetical protein